MGNTITVKLTKEEIDEVFLGIDPANWNKVLDVYIFLRENLARADDQKISAEYQKKFNYFYQVRRNAEWREKFYSLFYKYSKERNADFADILNALFKRTGMIEASFSSKFAAATAYNR